MNRKNASKPGNRRSGRTAAAEELAPEKPKRKVDRTRPSNLRIIGGSLRGRSVRYHGNAFTRPMKDSVRENLFNILGPAIKGTRVFDLFAGTAALSFEAVSRGATEVIAVEQSRHASRFIRGSAENLGVGDRLTVLTGNAFRLADRLLEPPSNDIPWIVLLCPPYAMWEDETEITSLTHIISRVRKHAPPGSLLVAETEKRFDVDTLPAGDWDWRTYGNTRLGFLEIITSCGLDPSFADRITGVDCAGDGKTDLIDKHYEID